MKFSTNRNEQCKMETMSFNEAIELYSSKMTAKELWFSFEGSCLGRHLEAHTLMCGYTKQDDVNTYYQIAYKGIEYEIYPEIHHPLNVFSITKID